MKSGFTLAGFVAAAVLAAPLATRAEHPRTATPLLAAYQRECASCHIAYPPGLLPAASWERLMDNLPRHFGTDASLDAAQVREIGAWLARNASARTAVPPEDRITRTAWFVREHREVATPVWKRAAVGSAANCAACHTRAEQGDFDEDRVRIPR